jgi:probable F420-dependent oxidoreductase
MDRLGLSIPNEGLTLRESVDLAQRAEVLGYTDVWTSEAAASDGFTPLVAVAARTERVRLGVAIVSAFTRPPALIAMTAATVQALAGGRFCLGMGSSTESIVGRWMGLDFARPFTRVRESVEVVRRALKGEKVDYQGETLRVQGFRLQLPAPASVPILLGALGPRMFRLAGKIADGVILTNVGPRAIPSLLADFWDGVAASGRTRDDVDIICRVLVAPEEDENQVRAALRRYIAGYLSTMPYRRFLSRQGFEADARAAWDAWQQGSGRAAAEAVSDQLLEELFVFGDADTCRARLRAFREAGARTLLIAPLSIHPDPDERRRRIARALDLFAPALLPL